MAQNYLPAGPSVPKPALSPAQGPGDTHAHPMTPKITRPQPAGTQPDLACQQRTLLPNTAIAMLALMTSLVAPARYGLVVNDLSGWLNFSK